MATQRSCNAKKTASCRARPSLSASCLPRHLYIHVHRPWHIIQRGNNRSACYRYIELNPIRAQMVEHPAEYPWSSFRCNGEGQDTGLITPHEEYQRLGVTEDERLKYYRALFESHLEPGVLDEIRTSTNGSYVLGNECFKQEIANMLNRRVIPGKAGRPVTENVD